MIEIKSGWKSVTDRERWAARGASFVAKAKATKAVWFPPKPEDDWQEGRLEGQECHQEGDQEDNRCGQEDDQGHQECDQASTRKKAWSRAFLPRPKCRLFSAPALAGLLRMRIAPSRVATNPSNCSGRENDEETAPCRGDPRPHAWPDRHARRHTTGRLGRPGSRPPHLRPRPQAGRVSSMMASAAGRPRRRSGRTPHPRHCRTGVAGGSPRCRVAR